VTRRRWAAGVVCFVAIWPAVVAVASATLDVDPWKWGGFGMYSTAARVPGSMQVTVLISAPPDASRVVRLENASWVPAEPGSPALTAEVHRFMLRRQTMGRLETGRQLAETALATVNAPEALLVVSDFRLEASSARVREQITLLRFRAHSRPH